jgi:aspartate 1-decarboxylase
MFRKLLKSRIHRAKVTKSDLTYEGSIAVYEGSIAVDAALLEASDIQPFEAVLVWNVTNGTRLRTYAFPLRAGSGEICLNGAAARSAQAGDVVIIASFAWVDEKEAMRPKLVFVDAQNRIVEIKA